MDAALDRVSRNRLYWKCRRGLLELDLVLQRFIPDDYDRSFEETVARLRAA
jgi:antitoxin CptB